MANNSIRGWMTLDEVQEFLGHSQKESTEVWLSRHGLRPVRVYRASDVRAERGKPQGRPRGKRGKAIVEDGEAALVEES